MTQQEVEAVLGQPGPRYKGQPVGGFIIGPIANAKDFERSELWYDIDRGHVIVYFNRATDTVTRVDSKLYEQEKGQTFIDWLKALFDQ
jgi:hypothetical protein